jgi:group I intron endonuclease
LSIASSTLGRLHSEETILKISNSLRGKSIPELVKQKMSLSRQGKVFSDETKKILSELRMGKDSPFLGKQHSADTRIKMSEALGSKIEVFNKNTLETTIYSSNYKAAEAIGCSESTIRY